MVTTSKLKGLLILFLVITITSQTEESEYSTTDGKFFRYDYTYHEDIEGWLKFHPIPATWQDARLRCQLEGAILASPLNKAFLMTLKNKISHDIFTGIHATLSKGDYFSIEGVPLDRMSLRWAPDEPNNCDNSEECLVLYSDGTVADVKCDEVFPFACYRKAINTKFDPNCGTVDKGYILNLKTGNCNKFHNASRTWQNAFKTCSSEGGYLAIINSADEVKTLISMFAKYKGEQITALQKDRAFVGFYNSNEPGTWITIHGETLEEAGYYRWDSGQRDYKTSGRLCGAMLRNGLLIEKMCDDYAPFFCEKNRHSLLVDGKFD